MRRRSDDVVRSVPGDGRSFDVHRIRAVRDREVRSAQTAVEIIDDQKFVSVARRRDSAPKSERADHGWLCESGARECLDEVRAAEAGGQGGEIIIAGISHRGDRIERVRRGWMGAIHLPGADLQLVAMVSYGGVSERIVLQRW